MEEEQVRRLVFEYDFKEGMSSVTKAYLNKYKYEDRYSLSTFSKVEQKGDEVCLTRVMNSVISADPLKEEICINRNTNTMKSKIIMPTSETRVPEINYFSVDGQGTKHTQEIYQTDGR